MVGYNTGAGAVQQNILVFGDSLSAGYGIASHASWPHLLQLKLNEKNLPYQIINHSISGETTGGGRSRFSDSLQRAAPDIVILELGANDGLRGLSFDTMQANLQAMIDMARDKDIKVLLVATYLPSNYGEAYIARFHQRFVQLAEKNDTAFLPFLMQGLGTGLEMYQADGLHPTAAAQSQMMENVWTVLQPLL